MAIAPEAPKEQSQEPQAPAPQEPKPAAPSTPPAQPPAAPAETAEQRAARLERELQERDSKINDLSTTLATIDQRQRELEARTAKGQTEDEIEKESREIAELMLVDPAAAARKNAELLRKIQRNASQQAQGTIAHQTIVEKLRAGVKSSNPDFDEDVVDYVMERADKLASTGKFKTAEEAVNAAVTLVKSKFDGYAHKRNSAPPLPQGALVEGGGNPPPAPAPKAEVLPTPAEELGNRREAQMRKII